MKTLTKYTVIILSVMFSDKVLVIPPEYCIFQVALWDAWDSSKGLTRHEAAGEFVRAVDELAKSAEVGPISYERAGKDVETSLEAGVLTLTLNRPHRFNAMNLEMYTVGAKLNVLLVRKQMFPSYIIRLCLNFWSWRTATSQCQPWS